MPRVLNKLEEAKAPITHKLLKDNEENLGIVFPDLYKSIVLKADGAVLGWPTLECISPCLDGMLKTSICNFISQNLNNSTNILSLCELLSADYGLPGLVPFAEEGTGDKICFDYRGKYKINSNPPVVYLHHDFPNILKKNPFLLAPNFLAFMEMLQPDPEHPADENAMEVEI